MVDVPGTIAVHGPAGVGKTALVEAALGARAVFVVASAKDSEARLARRALLALGLPEVGRVEARSRLVAAVADRPGLVLVVDAADEARAASIALARRLSSAGACGVLVARSVLSTGDERRLAVAPLGVPEEASLRASDAFRTWSALVERVRPRYRVRDDELALVARILRRLDGLPLAMAIVAPQMSVLDHASLLRELDDDRAHGHAGPLASIRRLLRASFATLAARERTLLQRAAAFPGSFDAARLREVARGERPAALHATLQSLVERSWIVVDEAKETLRVLGVVRDFVRTNDPAAARRADEELVRAFAALAVRWNEAAERAFAIDPIRAHAAELYRAAELAESERDPKRSVALLGALRHLVQIGQAPPGLPDRVAAALRKVRRGDARARLLHAELLVARSAEHAPEVARLAETIRRTAVKDRFLRGAALHALGSIAIESGASSAARLLDEARAVFAGWSSEEALVLTHRAIVEQRQGRIPAAIALLREASAIARRFGSARAIATVASVLGALLAEHGSSAEASSVLNEAISVAAATGDRRTEAYAQVCRGASLLARADAGGAAECFRRAVTLFRDVGAPTYEAFARQELGIALAELGERTAARAELERALVELRASGYEAAALGEAHLALLDWEEGAPDVARARLDRLRSPASERGGFAAVVAIAHAFLEGRLEETATTTDERVLQRRAGALLRRSGRIAIRITEDGSTFSAGSTAVALHAKPALRGVLAALARARGSIVAPDELVARAWPGEKARPAAALNRLYVAIRRLRALGLEGAIENVPGGYRLVATAQIVPVSTK